MSVRIHDSKRWHSCLGGGIMELELVCKFAIDRAGKIDAADIVRHKS